jgi:hypothetical protein
LKTGRQIEIAGFGLVLFLSLLSLKPTMAGFLRLGMAVLDERIERVKAVPSNRGYWAIKDTRKKME